MSLFISNKVADVELVYGTKVKPSERPLVKSSKDCNNLQKLTRYENKIEFIKQFKVLLLFGAQVVLGIYELSAVGVPSKVADLKLVFTKALKANTCDIIFSHNHPSGNYKPTEPTRN